MEDPNNYAIVRHNKLATRDKIAVAIAHNDRSSNPSNADPNREATLVYGYNDPLQALDNLLSKYDIKPRKNACLAGEYLLTFSPEMKDKIDLDKWVKANIEFIIKEHSEESILSAHLHEDETTPHLHIITAPLVEKEITNKHNKEPVKKMRLAAVDFWKGKEMLAARHDRYAEAMSEFGLERGRRYSNADHNTIKNFYKEIDQTEALMRDLMRQNQEKFENMTSRQKAAFADQERQLEIKRQSLSERELAIIEQETELEFKADEINKSAKNKLEIALEALELEREKNRKLNAMINNLEQGRDFNY